MTLLPMLQLAVVLGHFRCYVVVPSAVDAEISSVPTDFPSSLKILNAKAICLHVSSDSISLTFAQASWSAPNVDMEE